MTVHSSKVRILFAIRFDLNCNRSNNVWKSMFFFVYFSFFFSIQFDNSNWFIGSRFRGKPQKHAKFFNFMKYHKTQQKHYEINRTFENKKKTPQKHDKYRKMIENTHKTPGKTPQKNHENQRSDKD